MLTLETSASFGEPKVRVSEKPAHFSARFARALIREDRGGSAFGNCCHSVFFDISVEDGIGWKRRAGLSGTVIGRSRWTNLRGVGTLYVPEVETLAHRVTALEDRLTAIEGSLAAIVSGFLDQSPMNLGPILGSLQQYEEELRERRAPAAQIECVRDIHAQVFALRTAFAASDLKE